MKLYYFLFLVSSIAFGQVNTEKIVDITWYRTASQGTENVYSSVKSHKKSNYYIKFKSDQTYIVPSIQRRRCTLSRKPALKGTWSMEFIDGVSFLYLTRNNRTTTYKILYANQGILKLKIIKSYGKTVTN